MSTDFKFKQFSVSQRSAAMKVGTDGVMLGAWCTTGSAVNILDVGTGTGVISLMLAQRCPSATITALEIDKNACEDAYANFSRSPWNARLNLLNMDCNHYSTNLKFDLIVSNPPFFSNSLKSPSSAKTTARHITTLRPDSVASWAEMLTVKGLISVIYPVEVAVHLLEQIASQGLFAHRICYIKPTAEKQPHRMMLEFGKAQPAQLVREEVIIEDTGRHEYSEAYRNLCRDFYLKF